MLLLAVPRGGVLMQCLDGAAPFVIDYDATPFAMQRKDRVRFRGSTEDLGCKHPA
jgi:hypothetical protein